jgi:hypothetical protein
MTSSIPPNCISRGIRHRRAQIPVLNMRRKTISSGPSPEEVIEVAHEAGFSLQMSQYPFESDWFLDKIPVHLIQKMWNTADGEICVQLNNCTIFTTKEDINFIDGNAISNFF